MLVNNLPDFGLVYHEKPLWFSLICCLTFRLVIYPRNVLVHLYSGDNREFSLSLMKVMFDDWGKTPIQSLEVKFEILGKNG